MSETTIDRTDLERALLAIADPEKSYRYDLDRPAVRGGRLWATDGCIAAWIPTDRADDVERVGSDGITRPIKFPNMTFLLERQPTCWIPLAHCGEIDCETCHGVGQIEASECPDCRGNGKCDNCMGTGQNECCTCGSSVVCDDCRGNGRCPSCRGARIRGPAECPRCWNGIQVFFGVRCTRRWLRKVFDLQLLGPLEVGTTTDGNLAFRVGELEGVLMRSCGD